MQINFPSLIAARIKQVLVKQKQIVLVMPSCHSYDHHHDGQYIHTPIPSWALITMDLCNVSHKISASGE